MKKLILFVSSLLLVGSGFAAATTADTAKPAKPVVKQAKHNTKSLAQQVKDLQDQMDDLKTHRLGRDEFGFVSTSPYLGIRATYDPNDLLVNLPSVNEDFRLLQQRQEIANYVAAHDQRVPDRPIIDLSGSVEAQGISKRDFTGGSKSDVDLSRAELDVIGDINPWVTGVMIISYDNAPASSGARGTNSKLYINRGFITIGNFNKSPVYGTVGQIYVPFGQYTNFMVTTPLTQSMARTKARAAEIGYSHELGIYGSLYAYKGDTYMNDRNNVINSWGANLGYTKMLQDAKMDIGAGFMHNIADSEGMMDNGAAGTSYFKGFKDGKKLRHNVPAVDVHGSLKYTNYSLVAEYIDSIRVFDTADMTYDGRGARPQALDLEFNYDFKVMEKPMSVACGYGRTWQALALNLPKHSAFAKVGAAWWKSTIEAIEYRHDWNYGRSDTATGAGYAFDYPPQARTRNIVTAQIGVYF